MTTVVLIVMCVVVGALELYAGKQSRDQARAFTRRVDELNEQVTKQNNVLVTVGEQLTAELGRVKRDVLPTLDDRVRRTTGRVEELADVVHRADEFVRTQAGRLRDLEQQRVTLAALRRKLAEIETSVRDAVGSGDGDASADVREQVDTALERLADLERGGAEILELQRTLTRTLEEVEDIVAELLQFTEGALDDAVTAALTGRPRALPAGSGGLPAGLPGGTAGADPRDAAVTATGRLWTRDDQLEDILTDVYERCVRANRLSVRFRTAEGADGLEPGSPERRRYFLGGQLPDDLAGAFSALLISTGADLPHGGLAGNGGARRGLARVEPGLPAGVEPARPPEDESALKSLLRTLAECSGAVAQIGPLMAVRTRDELVCAVLSAGQSLELESDEVFWDPASAAVRLRRLPSHQLWDLTAWATTP
ncbi:hypothetical protein [Actinomadura algeriensis]|uniref:Coiled-coil protein SlyX n=1 Tax=Actinomadura algeriensis TaxID=1679523 RepID=A0ABR9JW59_9ACTN|nr:hypothetical protein [Actinomadura algeriensis]MBE1534802.1 putative coiled-coil protein SlyX [Actinomadura algeriensis]